MVFQMTFITIFIMMAINREAEGKHDLAYQENCKKNHSLHSCT